MLKIIFDYVIT